MGIAWPGPRALALAKTPFDAHKTLPGEASHETLFALANDIALLTHPPIFILPHMRLRDVAAYFGAPASGAASDEYLTLEVFQSVSHAWTMPLLRAFDDFWRRYAVGLDAKAVQSMALSGDNGRSYFDVYLNAGRRVEMLMPAPERVFARYDELAHIMRTFFHAIAIGTYRTHASGAVFYAAPSTSALPLQVPATFVATAFGGGAPPFR
jgi:hypothetical protein